MNQLFDFIVPPTPFFTGWASAFKVVDQFGANATVEAGRNGCAFVDFIFAQGARESWPALAVVFVDLIQAAVGTDGIARVVQAFVDVNLALDAEETGPTLALEALQRIGASASVLARLAPAIVDAVLAVFAGEAQGAKASIIAFDVLALASVQARVGRAFVHLNGAVGTRPAWLTNAQGVKVAVDASAVFAAR